jgi:formylglycine-generating enzyme required for sulfatase activity
VPAELVMRDFRIIRAHDYIVRKYRSAGSILTLMLALAGQSSAEQLGTPSNQPGRTFRDCADCPEMVVIPAGKFAMGSTDADSARDLAAVTGTFVEFARRMAKDAFAREHPQHEVTIDHPFALGKYLVTRGEFAAFARETGYSSDGPCLIQVEQGYQTPSDSGWQNPGFIQTDRDPVVCVNWKDAQAYVVWLNRKLPDQGTAAQRGSYVLPTEAQWEFAARAGTQTARWWGDPIGTANADCIGCGSQWDNIKPAPVGIFRSNVFGLYEMMGNTFEWTEDCWNEDYLGAPRDGGSRTDGNCNQRVVRGGSWASNSFTVRSAARSKFNDLQRANFIGFRVAKVLE